MRGNISRVSAGVVLCMALTVPGVAAKASVDRIEGFPSVTAVRFEADFPLQSLMRMECAFVQRTARPDGSAVESQRCTLSDEPVMIPAFQGEAPARAFIHDTGPCLWGSDYLLNASEELVLAENAHVVVTPSGQVHVTSFYPAEPLVCEE